MGFWFDAVKKIIIISSVTRIIRLWANFIDIWRLFTGRKVQHFQEIWNALAVEVYFLRWKISVLIIRKLFGTSQKAIKRMLIFTAKCISLLQGWRRQLNSLSLSLRFWIILWEYKAVFILCDASHTKFFWTVNLIGLLPKPVWPDGKIVLQYLNFYINV